MPRTKYKKRPDGRRVCAKSYTDFGDFHYTGRKYFYGSTDEEIDNKIADWEKSQQRQNNGSVRTFREVADEWWSRKENEISGSTSRGYRSYVSFLSDEFGEHPVDEITPQMIITYLRKVAAQGYSRKVIKNRKTILKGILDEALIAGEITANPCLNLPIIKGAPPKKRLPASDDDLKKIEAYKDTSLYAKMFYFMLFTGCRRGEAVALQQKNIDIETGSAVICQSVVYKTNSPLLKSPKTEAGIRRIDLYDNVIEILPHYEDPETFVFFPEGLPTEKQLEYNLEKFRKDTGISATAHQLRHSYATLLHTIGIDAKNAQSLLGHSSVVVTQDIYTEIEEQSRCRVRSEVNDYINNHLLSKMLSEDS